MNIPFNLRNGIKPKTVFDENSISKEFNIALSHLLLEFLSKNIFLKSIPSKEILIQKLKQAGRITIIYDNYETYDQLIYYYLEKIEWFRTFNFIEKIYTKIENEKNCYENFNEYRYEDIGTIDDAKRYFADELNYILLEENLPFEFIDGLFKRKGKYQTNTNISSAYKVLIDSKYEPVLQHFSLARKAFEKFPESDYTNTAKESVCAIEALVHILTKENASTNFNKALQKIVGNERGRVPKLLAQLIEKIYAYRGDAKGVTHASLEGSKINENEAEFILSCSASIITYLISVSIENKESIPF